MFSLVGLFCSCGSDDEPTPEPTLSISPESIEFTSEAESDQFTIESNTSWNVSCNRSWCTLNSASGQGNRTIVVEVDENKDLESRTCRITVTTADGVMSRNITVTQKGGKASLSVSPADVELASSKDATASVTLTTQASWTISGVPEWLSVPKSGMGNTALNLRTITANDTDEPRVANLDITAGTTTASLKVTQLPARVKCYVEPKNLVALSNDICFEFEGTSNVNIFAYLILSQSAIDRYTDKEIEDELINEAKEDPNKISDNYIMFPGGMNSDSKYYICTLAFDKDNNPGSLKKVSFKTKKSANIDTDPWVRIGDESGWGDSGFQIDCIKEGYCDTYHIIMGNLDADHSWGSEAIAAFEINYYIQYKKKHWYAENWELEIITNYPNSHLFTYDTYTLPWYPIIYAYTWGLTKDGTLAPFLNGIEYDTSDTSSTMVKNKPLKAPKANTGIVYRKTTRKAESIKKNKQ